MTRIIRALVLAAAIQAVGMPAYAAPFSLTTFAGANLGCVPQGAPPNGCPNFNGDAEASYQVTGGAGLLSISDLTDAFNDPFFTYVAQADAAFGSLHARASGSYNLPTPSYRGAAAGAIATDQLTISGVGQSGHGTLDVSFQLNGQLQQTGNAGSAVFVIAAAGPNEDPFDGTGRSQIVGYDGTNPPLGLITFSLDFVWDQPFYLSMALASGVGSGLTCMSCEDGDADFRLVTGAGTGTSDFFNTLTLTGLVPKVNGSPVLNAQYASASGTQYSINGVQPPAVPESGSLLLLGTGIVALGARTRRRGGAA